MGAEDEECLAMQEGNPVHIQLDSWVRSGVSNQQDDP